MLPKKLADVYLNFHITPIDLEGDNVFANMTIVMDDPVVNGVEVSIDLDDSAYDSIKAAMLEYGITVMIGYGPYDLQIDPDKVLTPRPLNISSHWTVRAFDVNGDYESDNLTIARRRTTFNGVEFFSFAEQNIVTYNVLGLSISALLSSQLTAAGNISIPPLLRAVDIANGRDVPLILS